MRLHPANIDPRPWAAALLLAISLFVHASQDEAPRPAIEAPLAAEALVLDLIEVDGRIYAVGERGHVLISEDGKQWRQAEHVPVQATLTRITHADGRFWAVGHDTTIIYSTDGGENWELQFFDPGLEQPLLDVLFFNAEQGIALGAYGLYMVTADGGASWQSETIAERVTFEAIDWEEATELEEEFDDEMYRGDDQDFDDGGWNDDDDPWANDDFYDAEMDFDRGCYEFLECHLNKILRLSEDELMIAAEQGYGYRSSDRGETWESFRFPYPGSMFGLLPIDGCVVAFGLRGHIQKSCNFGDQWEVLESGTDQTLMGGDTGPDGEVVMAGAGATRITLHPDGRLERAGDRLGSDYATILVTIGGARILGGEDGVRRD